MKFVADVLAPEAQGSIAWVRVYRSLDHRTTRNRLAEAASTFPVLEPFCQLFAKLLDQRQLADYSTEAFELTGDDVFQLITEAANAMKAFETLSEEQRLSVAVMLLLPERKENTLQR